MMEVTVHYTWSSAVRWLQMNERGVGIFKEKDSTHPEDYILLRGDTSIKETNVGRRFGVKVKISSFRHNKSFTFSVDSQEEQEKLIKLLSDTIEKNPIPEMDEIPENIDENENKLRICSYNINFGLCDGEWYSSSEESVVAAMVKAKADIILLQETNQHWEEYLLHKNNLKNHYPYYEFNDWDNEIDLPAAGGIGFLSKYPIISTTIIPSPSEWFPGQLIIIDTPIGEIQFLNLHLRPPLTHSALPLPHAYFTSKKDREREVQWYGTFLKSNIPTIVCGDFNENSDAKSAQYFSKNLKMRCALDEFKQGITWWWNLPFGYKATARFDHIFYNRLYCKDAYVIPEGYSDHYPVVGEFIKI